MYTGTDVATTDSEISPNPERLIPRLSRLTMNLTPATSETSAILPRMKGAKAGVIGSMATMRGATNTERIVATAVTRKTATRGNTLAQSFPAILPRKRFTPPSFIANKSVCFPANALVEKPSNANCGSEAT
jgi:hypothetical protein